MRIKHLLSLLGLFIVVTASAAPSVTLITNAPYFILSPGNYRLAKDINWTGSPLNTSAIFIGSSNVNLDLNGKTLTGDPYYGPNTNTAIGIFALGSANLTISNGTVNGFHSGGITLVAASQTKIVNLTIKNINNLGAWSAVPTNAELTNIMAGFTALDATNLTLSNVAVQNINLQSTNANIGLAQVGGIFMVSCANVTNINVSVSGVSDNCGVAEGIGIIDTVGATILRSTITNISTGDAATNNYLGHTCLGMVFSPVRLSGNMIGATVVSGGSGYSGYPPVTISAVTNDAGSNGYGYALVSPSGQVTDIIVTNIATNYETFPQVTIGGSGTGAQAVVQPNQLSYTTIGSSGNILVQDCTISNITGALDDAHGISLFTVTNAVVRRVHVNGVTDGSNSYGFGGSKATGFENYGNPVPTNCNIVVEDCIAENITAIGPADLTANGFSAAGNGIRFSRCTAKHVQVTGTNRLDPLASPGVAAGFGWAPDVRIQNIYPARRTIIEACTATECPVCFDTFNFENSIWRSNRGNIVPNGIRYLQEPDGTTRTIFGGLPNEVCDAELYPDAVKAIPIYNTAQGNTITPAP